MAGTKGMRHHKPASTPARANLVGDIADPANGEKVVRCRICGVPATEGNAILPCNLGYIHRNTGLNVCERCFLVEERRNEAEMRMTADPLTVWEEVA